MLGDSRLEHAICLLLEDAECRKVRERPIPLVKDSEVETFVARKGLISYDFSSQEQVLFLSLFLLGFHLDTFFVQSSFWKRNESVFCNHEPDTNLLKCGGVSSSVNGDRTSSIAVSWMYTNM